MLNMRDYQVNITKFSFLFILFAMLFCGCAIHPKIMDKNETWQQASIDMVDLFKNQEPITEPITLYEAMARAIKYNREHRLKMMESALAMHETKLSRFDLLPKLTASAGYQGRDDERASSSESYKTGQESLEASISQDKHLRTSDITFTWNVLDFGLSYVRAKQQSDKYLMAKEVERKTIHNIIREVNVAWWDALTAQNIIKEIDPLMIRVQNALTDSEMIEKQRLDSPLKALNYQRSLVEMLRSLETLKKNLLLAKPKLASLMGVPFGQDFYLEQPAAPNTILDIYWDMPTMEKIALLARPELMEARYKSRITEKETKAAILKILPNINMDAGWNWDSNSYLVDSNWIDYGARVSWNMFNIFKTPQTLDMIKISKKVQKERTLAMSMSVLMQLHIAKVNYIQSKKRFLIDDKAYSIEKRIFEQIQAATLTKSNGEQSLISQELAMLLSKVKKEKSYSELKNNFHTILISMGIDPMPESIDDNSVAGVAEAINTQLQKWNKPNLNEIENIDNYLPL